MNNLSLFKSLVDIPSPSGFENSLQQRVISLVSPLVDKVEIDVQGNLLAYKYAKNETSNTLLLMAHADEVGLMVQHIEDNGFIRFSKIGGVDIPILRGREVYILHNGHSIPGVIGVRPVHMKNESSKNDIDISDLWIDLGTSSRVESESLISIGDPIIIDSKCSFLSNNIVSGRACDDKAGIIALINVLENLKADERECKYNIVVVMSVQEEVGTRGAFTATYQIKPTIGIAIDVAHATDYPTINKAKHGDIRLGKGVTIPIGTDLSYNIQRQLMDIATTQDIPFQTLALPGPSGTDAHAMQISRGGCLVGLVSIPCRYMHSPVEVVSIDDIDYTARLLANYCCMV